MPNNGRGGKSATVVKGNERMAHDLPDYDIDDYYEWLRYKRQAHYIRHLHRYVPCTCVGDTEHCARCAQSKDSSLHWVRVPVTDTTQ